MATGALVLLALIVYLGFFAGGGSPSRQLPPAHGHAAVSFPSHSPLNPHWRGDGKVVTFAFGGDVHFAGAVGIRLTADPATALGNTVGQLLSGAQLRMVNLESALTDGTCPQQQAKEFIFDAPPTALTAMHNATINLISQANDHAVDCGQTGLDQGLAAAKNASFPIVGAGLSAAQAFAPYRVKINGQRIAVIAATQVLPPGLEPVWTATSAQGGVASAVNPTQLVRAVQAARKTADTVVVYLHWGEETHTCPDSDQLTLAKQLVKAGADIIVGTNAHVLQGGGYLGDSYVDYGLGNFAFYDNTAPETDSGALLITAEGRHVTSATFRPATDVDGLPQPLSGTPAATALQSWNAARACTNLAAAPSASQATPRGETVPFVAPPTTTTTASTTTSSTTAGATTTTAAGGTTTTAAGGTTTTTHRGTHKKASTTTTRSTSTPPATDNAG